LEIRRIWTSTDLNGYLAFPFVGQVACIEREVQYIKTGQTHGETVYLVSSLSPEKASPQRLLSIVRNHWTIENQDHYVRDVTFGEDHSQIRTRSGPRVMATLRKFAISVLRLSGHTNIAKATRGMASKPHLALAAIGL